MDFFFWRFRLPPPAHMLHNVLNSWFPVCCARAEEKVSSGGAKGPSALASDLRATNKLLKVCSCGNQVVQPKTYFFWSSRGRFGEFAFGLPRQGRCSCNTDLFRFDMAATCSRSQACVFVCACFLSVPYFGPATRRHAQRPKAPPQATPDRSPIHRPPSFSPSKTKIPLHRSTSFLPYPPSQPSSWPPIRVCYIALSGRPSNPPRQFTWQSAIGFFSHFVAMYHEGDPSAGAADSPSQPAKGMEAAETVGYLQARFMRARLNGKLQPLTR